MNYLGKIKKWEDKKGFGFIQETRSSSEIFAHISSFHVQMPRPQIGEEVSFDIAINAKGKREAKNIRRYRHGVEITSAPPPSSSAYLHKNSTTTKRSHKSSNFWINVISLLIFLISGYMIYTKYFSGFSTAQTNSGKPLAALFASETSASKPEQHFRCDGRTHCSQMRSCKEAKFFLKNCPGVKMDGDNDGTPCEQQWCTGLFD